MDVTFKFKPGEKVQNRFGDIGFIYLLMWNGHETKYSVMFRDKGEDLTEEFIEKVTDETIGFKIPE